MAIFLNSKKSLYLYDDEKNILLNSYEFGDDKIFSIEFIHSVNKSPIIDFYTYNNANEIENFKTMYYNFGAGVETELEGNETLRYGENGEMIIENINKKFKSLSFIVGTVYNHILTINDKKYNLNELYGKNRHIKFVIK